MSGRNTTSAAVTPDTADTETPKVLAGLVRNRSERSAKRPAAMTAEQRETLSELKSAVSDLRAALIARDLEEAELCFADVRGTTEALAESLGI